MFSVFESGQILYLLHDGMMKGLYMPKQKTKKSAVKRFKLTATGKVTYHKAGSGHLLSSKSRKRKRTLRGSSVLSKPEQSRITGMLSS